MARSFQESGSIVQGALLRIVVAISFLESILLDRNGALTVHARWLGPGTSAPRGESSIAWSIACPSGYTLALGVYFKIR